MYVIKETSTNAQNRKSINQLCALGKAMSLLEGRWKVVIIWHLRNGKMRFTEIDKSIVAASKRMIAKQLKEMETDGLVYKTIIGVKPPLTSFYELTKTGRELIPIVTELRSWGQKLSI